MATSIMSLSLISLAALLFLTPKISGVAAMIGLCYTRNGSGQLTAKDVVSMYKNYHFGAIRMFEPDPDLINAIGGSKIKVVVGVPNNKLEQLATSMNSAYQWVQANIVPYTSDVQFNYIVAGDEAIGGTSSHSRFVMGAMTNLHKALASFGLEHHIKVTTAISPITALSSWNLPSRAVFSENTRADMASIATFLADHDAPLLANVYTYFSYINNRIGIPLSYALCTEERDIIEDGQLGYRRLFDAMVDALYAALEKVGAPDLRVVVSETGWPSVGRSSVATVENAMAYMWNLKKHVTSGIGTPRRRGMLIETYMFSAFHDEMKHAGDDFGLFYANMKPVYNLPNM